MKNAHFYTNLVRLLLRFLKYEINHLLYLSVGIGSVHLC